MPLVVVGVCILAAYLLRSTGLFSLAVINAVASFWSMRFMVRTRDEPIRNNRDRVMGGISMLSTLLGIILLIVALVRRFN